MKLHIIIAFAALLFFGKAFSQTNVSGAYFSNEVWTQSGSPYKIVGDVQIPAGYNLTIEPGVTIEYTGPYEILIKGGIIANGTTNDSIIFTSSPGINSGITMLNFIDVDFSNSQISYSKFINADTTISIQGMCTNLINFKSVYITSSEIFNESKYVNIILSKSRLEDINIDNRYNADSSKIIIDSSFVNNCNFKTEPEIINTPGMVLKNSFIINSSFLAGPPFDAEMELNNVKCNNCTFSTNYGKLTINDSKIKNSGFNNHNTIQQCQVFFDINRSIIVNTSMESSLTNPANAWWSTFNIHKCIIKKDTSTLLGFEVGDITNSIIIGTNNQPGVSILQGSFNNVTIINNNIGVIREQDNSPFSIINSNIFNNSSYNLQNSSDEDISGINNFWGYTDSINIEQSIYHYYDDIYLGEVNLNNYLSTPNTDCPISPPQNLTITPLANSSELSWSNNPETDIKGYKIYYGFFDGFNFQYSIDNGNDTTFIIPDSISTDSIAVTAYDSTADNHNDMVDGHESWYSIISDTIITDNKNEYIGDIFKFNLYPNPTNYMVTVELSDINKKMQRIELINANGVILCSREIDNNFITKFDISEYPDGIYFLKVIFEKFTKTKRIIKN